LHEKPVPAAGSPTGRETRTVVGGNLAAEGRLLDAVRNAALPEVAVKAFHGLAVHSVSEVK